MAQLCGSGTGNGINYAMVDSSIGTNQGRLLTVSDVKVEEIGSPCFKQATMAASVLIFQADVLNYVVQPI